MPTSVLQRIYICRTNFIYSSCKSPADCNNVLQPNGIIMQGGPQAGSQDLCRMRKIGPAQEVCRVAKCPPVRASPTPPFHSSTPLSPLPDQACGSASTLLLLSLYAVSVAMFSCFAALSFPPPREQTTPPAPRPSQRIDNNTTKVSYIEHASSFFLQVLLQCVLLLYSTRQHLRNSYFGSVSRLIFSPTSAEMLNSNFLLGEEVQNATL